MRNVNLVDHSCYRTACLVFLSTEVTPCHWRRYPSSRRLSPNPATLIPHARPQYRQFRSFLLSQQDLQKRRTQCAMSPIGVVPAEYIGSRRDRSTATSTLLDPTLSPCAGFAKVSLAAKLPFRLKDISFALYPRPAPTSGASTVYTSHQKRPDYSRVQVPQLSPGRHEPINIIPNIIPFVNVVAMSYHLYVRLAPVFRQMVLWG